MIPFLVDENFNGGIVRGLFRRKPDLDLVTVRRVGLEGADDPTVLEWAADHQRIVISHDVQTLPGFAYQRVKARRRMPGVIEVPMELPIGVAIQDILIIEGASGPQEWEGQIIYLPL